MILGNSVTILEEFFQDKSGRNAENSNNSEETINKILKNVKKM